MATSYEGPVVLRSGNQETQARADLSIRTDGHLRSWAGFITVDGDGGAAVWEAFNMPGSMAELVMPDGAVGSVLIKPFKGGADVTGSGPVPF